MNRLKNISSSQIDGYSQLKSNGIFTLLADIEDLIILFTGPPVRKCNSISLELMFKPSLLEVIALITKDGGTLLNRRSTKFSKLILNPESWTVNQRFIGNAYRKKKA